MELTKFEIEALAKRCLKLADRALGNCDSREAQRLSTRASELIGIATQLGLVRDGYETHAAVLQVVDKPNPFVAAAEAAGWQRNQGTYRWIHPDRPNEPGYYSASSICDLEGLEVPELEDA
jgi:hypothetical protein